MAVTMALVCAGSPGLAQQSRASVSGKITDKATGVALPNVVITLLGDVRSVTTDSAGQYVFGGLSAGVAQFVIAYPGFVSHSIIVEVADGQHIERLVALDSTRAQSLPGVAITARAPVTSYRLVDFERRRSTGRGHYMDEEQIVKTGAYNLQDLVRSLRGVQLECPGGMGCRIHMARAQAGCSPEYVVDGRTDNIFGPSIPIRDVIALEVYTGPADVPGEFAGRNAGCGVIVMWTRSGPTRKKG